MAREALAVHADAGSGEINADKIGASRRQQGEPLPRLARSMLQLARVTLPILAMMQKFVASLRR